MKFRNGGLAVNVSKFSYLPFSKNVSLHAVALTRARGNPGMRSVPSRHPRGPLPNPNGIVSSSPGLFQPWAESHAAAPTPMGL